MHILLEGWVLQTFEDSNEYMQLSLRTKHSISFLFLAMVAHTLSPKTRIIGLCDVYNMVLQAHFDFVQTFCWERFPVLDPKSEKLLAVITED